MDKKTVASVGVSAQGAGLGDYRVAVQLNPLELRLLRRAIAKATDEGAIGWNQGLSRIAELDVLRWNALDDERQKKAAFSPQLSAVS